MESKGKGFLFLLENTAVKEKENPLIILIIKILLVWFIIISTPTVMEGSVFIELYMYGFQHALSYRVFSKLIYTN